MRGVGNGLGQPTVRGRRRVWGGVVAWNFFHAFCPPVQGSKEGVDGGGLVEAKEPGGVALSTAPGF